MTPHLQDAMLWGTSLLPPFSRAIPEVSSGREGSDWGLPYTPSSQGSVGRHVDHNGQFSRDSDGLSTTQNSAVHTSDSHLPSTKDKRVCVHL